MAFMQPDIFTGTVWAIETNDGTDYVPGDYGPDVLRDLNERHVHILAVERRQGTIGRLSAPGYLDATDWIPYGSESEAYAALCEEAGICEHCESDIDCDCEDSEDD